MKFKVALLLMVAAIASFAVAGPYGDLNKSVANSSDKDLFNKIADSPLYDTDKQLSSLAEDGEDATAAKNVRSYLELRSELETSGGQTSSTPIQSIKESLMYRKADDEGKNWLGRAIDRIHVKPPEIKPRTINPGSLGGSMDGLIYVVLGVLIVAILVCLFLVISKFTMSKSGKRKRGRAVALMEDDEPERSLDEWLELAAKLEAEGKFREAVRCLYVASLIKLDQYRVIRFDRTETNWEHHRKLMRSPKNPTSVDLTSRTREFDRIWYGNATTTRTEVETFRQTYQQLTEALVKAEKDAA